MIALLPQVRVLIFGILASLQTQKVFILFLRLFVKLPASSILLQTSCIPYKTPENPDLPTG